jgi:probable rRNA maturation factor
MSKRIDIAVTPSAPVWRGLSPSAASIARRAARAALRSAPVVAKLRRRAGDSRPVELAIVLSDDARVRLLNRDYRGRDTPTNVLSFGGEENARNDDSPLLLGDVVLAGETVRREAAAQGKSVAAHLSHLIVHGVLHLIGYDHVREGAARRMEAIEIEVLAALGLSDPYRSSAPRRPPARRRAA